MKKYLFIALCLLVVVTLAGCGKSLSQKAAEKTAESILEKSTGGKADVDIGTNTVKVNTNSGSWAVGGQVSLPSGFPSDAYVIDGNITMATSDTTLGSYAVSIETSKSISEAKQLYESNLKDKGWTSTLSSEAESGVYLAADKDNRTITVSISQSSDGKTTVILSISNKDQ